MRVVKLAAGAALFALIAAVSAHAAPSVETYGAMPSLDVVSISPDGTRLAYVSSSPTGTTMNVIEIGGGVLSSSPSGKATIRSLAWAGNDRLLVTTGNTDPWVAKIGPTMNFGEIVVINLKTKQTRSIQEVAGIYAIQHQGDHWVAYLSGENFGANPFNLAASQNLPVLWRIDLDTLEKTQLSAIERTTDFMVGPDGQLVAKSIFADAESKWSLSFGKGTVAEATGEFRDYRLRGYSADGQSLIVGPADGDFGDYYQVAMNGDGGLKPMHELEGASRLWFDPDTERLIGFNGPIATGGVTMLPARVSARVRGALAAFPGKRAHLVSASQDFGRMIVFAQGGDDAGTYWLVDIATGKATAIGSPYPLQPADLAFTRTVDYKASDGFAVHGSLTLPPGSSGRSLPLVVLPHDQPDGRDTGDFDWRAQAIASRGYAVFRPDPRGARGYGKAYGAAAVGEIGRKMQTDMSDGVAYLAGQGIVDAQRVCIVGTSYGGYAAVAGVTLQSGVYRCAVAYGGVYDLEQLFSNLTTKNPVVLEWARLVDTKTAFSTQARQASPFRFVDKASAPILLIHTEDRDVLVAKQAEGMQRALAKAGKSVQEMQIAGPVPDYRTAETRTALLKATLDFLEKYNPAN